MSNLHLRPGRLPGPYFHGIVSTQPSCANCPLRHKRPVLPDGPIPAKVCVVGEEPGKTEELKGRGLVGPSGQLLWNLLGPAVNLRREDTWVTNSALCRAEQVRLTDGAILSAAEVQKLATACCHQRLIDELTVVDPVVIIPVGKIALRQLTGIEKATIYAYRGSRMEVDLPTLSEMTRRKLAECPT